MEDIRLGSMLLESGLVSEADLERCLSIQALTGSVRPIGQVLVEHGLVDSETLERVLALQDARNASRKVDIAPADVMSGSLLQAAVANGASEMVVSEGRTVRIRVGHQWRDLTNEVVTGPQVWDFAREVAGHQIIEDVADRKHVVRAWQHGDAGSGSARVFRHFDGVAVRLTFAVVEADAKSVGLPNRVIDLAKNGRGMILVAGGRGVGRAEALLALAAESTSDQGNHVLVLDEEPLALPNAPALCVRRRLGQSPQERSAAIRSAVREDPDVLVVADVGDADTFDVALRAAEDGRLVIAYIDALSVIEALHRILDFYQPHDVPRLRASLAAALRALVVRRQMPRASGVGTVHATEVLLPDRAVRIALQAGELANVALMMRMEGGRCGHSLDQSMLELLVAGEVHIEDVFVRAEEKAWILQRTKDLQATKR